MHIRLKTFFAATIIAFAILGSASAHAVVVQQVESNGGVSALLVEDHTNPIIALHFAFRGGSSLDPEGMEGLADMTSSLIDEGAGDLDSQAFQGKLEDLSIGLGFNAGRDNFGGTLTTLSENRDEAFELLRLALSTPRFDGEPVERIRSQILAGLRQQSEDPDSIAGKALARAMFEGHPYARPRDGTPKSIARIDREAMARFVRERLARNNLVIGVTGDITPDELRGVLDDIFGDLPVQATPWDIEIAKVPATGALKVINKPIPQSAILFAQPGLLRDDPDFYNAYVLNYILGGGGFTSRLYKEIREKRGLAYSVYSYLSPRDYAALLLGGAGTANAGVRETLDVIRKQWGLIAQNGVTQSELNDAKTYMTGSYPLRFSASGKISDMLVGIQLSELGIDYFDKRNSYIEAVTLDDVNRVARELLDPGALTFVVVGEPEGMSETP